MYEATVEDISAVGRRSLLYLIPNKSVQFFYNGSKIVENVGSSANSKSVFFAKNNTGADAIIDENVGISNNSKSVFFRFSSGRENTPFTKN